MAKNKKKRAAPNEQEPGGITPSASRDENIEEKTAVEPKPNQGKTAETVGEPGKIRVPEDVLEETLRSIHRMEKYAKKYAEEDKEPEGTEETPQAAVAAETPPTIESVTPGFLPETAVQEAPHKAKSGRCSVSIFGESSLLREFIVGLLPGNPALFGALGLCPLLAAAKDLKSGVLLTFFAAAVLLWTALFSPFVKRTVPFLFRPPVFAALSVGMYCVLHLIFRPVFPGVFNAVGFYLPMLAVGSLAMIRSTEEEESALLPGMAVSAGQAVGYGVVVLLVSGIRELLLTGTLFGHVVGWPYRLPVAALPVMGFFILAFVGAAVRWICAPASGRRKTRREKKNAEILRETPGN